MAKKSTAKVIAIADRATAARLRRDWVAADPNRRWAILVTMHAEELRDRFEHHLAPAPGEVERRQTTILADLLALPPDELTRRHDQAIERLRSIQLSPAVERQMRDAIQTQVTGTERVIFLALGPDAAHGRRFTGRKKGSVNVLTKRLRQYFTEHPHATFDDVGFDDAAHAYLRAADDPTITVTERHNDETGLPDHFIEWGAGEAWWSSVRKHPDRYRP